ATDQLTPCASFNRVNTVFWGNVTTAWATRSAKAGVARPASNPRRISRGKIDGSMPSRGWYNRRQSVIVPNRVATVRLGDLKRRRYQRPWKQSRWAYPFCHVARGD